VTSLAAATAGKTVFAGIDRLERLKGLPLKLLAFERFLQQHPEHVGRVTLRQLALAAVERGDDYVTCRAQCAALAGRINAAFGAGTVVVDERDDASCQLQHRLALLSVRGRAA
jgi:trehalose 6-phosphate synthase/phosphatase